MIKQRIAQKLPDGFRIGLALVKKALEDNIFIVLCYLWYKGKAIASIGQKKYRFLPFFFYWFSGIFHYYRMK